MNTWKLQLCVEWLSLKKTWLLAVCCCCCWVASVMSNSAAPQMAAHQALPSLGFSRQEHWSGLPFPSPMHESKKVKVKSLSCVRLFAIPWTATYQAPLSMRFSRQEYWSGVPLPSPTSSMPFLKSRLWRNIHMEPGRKQWSGQGQQPS